MGHLGWGEVIKIMRRHVLINYNSPHHRDVVSRAQRMVKAPSAVIYLFFFRDYSLLIGERGREKEKERESKHTTSFMNIEASFGGYPRHIRL